MKRSFSLVLTIVIAAALTSSCFSSRKVIIKEKEVVRSSHPHEPPRMPSDADAVWVDGHWELQNGHTVWIPGHWKRE